MRRIPRSRQRAAALACVVLLTGMPAPAPATQVTQAANPFQACLDGRFDGWVKERVALVLNEDPRAGDVDDGAVATWTIETLGACRARAGGGDPAIEERFTKRMAQWREHIYEGVQRTYKLLPPD